MKTSECKESIAFFAANAHAMILGIGFDRGKTDAFVYIGRQSACLAGAGHFITLVKHKDGWKLNDANTLDIPGPVII